MFDLKQLPAGWQINSTFERELTTGPSDCVANCSRIKLLRARHRKLAFTSDKIMAPRPLPLEFTWTRKELSTPLLSLMAVKNETVNGKLNVRLEITRQVTPCYGKKPFSCTQEVTKIVDEDT